MSETPKKVERMERMLSAAGIYIEPNERYPDPFEDLEDEMFEEYIKAIKEEREANRKILDSMQRNMSLIARAIPSMKQRATEFKEDFNFLEKQITKMYKGE